MASTLKFVPLVLLLWIPLGLVQCLELDVGGGGGWAIPPPTNPQLFNDWASSNRFKVNDTLRFEYKNDSVMEVTQDEYEKCRSSYPMFFSNNGDTRFSLDRSGLFYFISGVSGHCERGLKMIIKVLEIESPPSGNKTATSSPTSAATPLISYSISAGIAFFFIVCLIFQEY